jgi:hypothetical protein
MKTDAHQEKEASLIADLSMIAWGFVEINARFKWTFPIKM